MNQLNNGSHFGSEPSYFEWWYFHFASANGFTANIVLHETDIFGLRKSPYVSMSYQLPHREPQYLKMGIPDGSIARGSEFLSQNKGLFGETEETVELSLTFPTGESFETTITKMAEPLTLNNCVLYQKDDKRSYWRLQVPFGRFNGILKIENEEFPVSGVVHHDHQWGNIPIQDFVSDWVWGHFSSSESSAVFFVIQTQKGGLIERYATFSPKSIQSSVSGGQAPHLAELKKAYEPELWFDEPTVIFPFGTTVGTRINPNTLLRSRVKEAHPGFSVTYLRWASDAIVTPPGNFHYGITEYIRIRKVD